ncbi:site-specific DNA-methyltransferase [Actomonas aquatica]|uniref:Methyltransferase n=1 Tax=Actomonas aquatica TaxID=2866162 RepID=A0ABZ1CAG7_9BACT|nr:site-specific DNA-methyltransferase [Opitutus sp. WL0086]WRQ88594.1 site-specific DNA-methyltransferase [Opitutus sp. WL0086]
MKKLTPDRLIQADVLDGLADLPDDLFQLIIADPPYGNVLVEESWDNELEGDAYLEWTEEWFRAALRTLRPDGLFFVFGQLGQREHRWIHVCSLLCRLACFHDMLIWDRVVGYNDRGDSFTPAYEQCLVLRKTPDTRPYFNKDAVRLPYDAATISRYLKDKRYKDLDARRTHLEKGKYATNLLRVPSLKGSSREKVGHPSQKPEKLISMLVESSSRPGDWVLDPFFGSGTTGVVCERLGRHWIGIEKDPGYCRIAEERIAAAQTRLESKVTERGSA